YEQSQRGKARAAEEAEQQQLAAELGIVPKPDDTPEGTIPEFNTDELITPVGEVNAEDRKVAEVEVYDPLDPANLPEGTIKDQAWLVNEALDGATNDEA